MNRKHNFREYIGKLINKVRKNDLYKGSLGSYIIKIGGSFLSIILHIVIARYLGEESYGKYSYPLTLINLLAIVSTFGFNMTSVRFISQYKQQNKYGKLKGIYKYSIFNVSRISIIIFLLYFITVTIITSIDYKLKLALLLAGALIPIKAFLKLGDGILRGHKKVIIAQIPEKIIRPILFILTIIILNEFLYDRLDAPDSIIIDICITSVALFIIYFYVSMHSNNKNKEKTKFLKKKWIKYSSSLLVVTIFNKLIDFTDIILVGMLLDTTNAGLYKVSSKIAGVILFSLQAVNSILAPIISELFHENDYKTLQKNIRRGNIIIVLSSIFISILLILFGKKILYLFGEEFTKVYSVFAVLLFGRIIGSIAGPTSILMSMTGYEKELVKVQGVVAFSNVVFNLILINIFGIIGASIATLLSTVIMNITISYLVYKNTSLISFYIPKKVFNKIRKY